MLMMLYTTQLTSTHHLHAVLKLPKSLQQPSLSTDQTILTPKFLTIVHFNLHSYYLNNFNQNCPFNCYGETVTHLTTFVFLYSCNNNITLKMTAVAAETC
jgi:hypothetical protein